MLIVKGLTTLLPGYPLHYDFSLPEAEVLGIVGASGSGKSTLFNLLAGFVSPSSGSMTWKGDDFTRVAPHLRPVSLLFQSHNLFEHKTVLENLCLTGVSEHKAMDGLAQIGLDGLHGRMPAQLSGGQQQRVGLVRSLVSERPILLLDEPFTGLDDAARARSIEALKTLRDNGKTLLLITHDANDLAAFEAQRLSIPQHA